jgi:hypothetical protein
MKGRCVVLDAERGAARVVTPRAPYRRDGLPRRHARGLTERARFTVDALAADVRTLLRDDRAPIVDPTGGPGDLAARPPPSALPRRAADDPLRVLRGVRLEAALGLRPPPTPSARRGRRRRGSSTSPRSVCATRSSRCSPSRPPRCAATTRWHRSACRDLPRGGADAGRRRSPAPHRFNRARALSCGPWAGRTGSWHRCRPWTATGSELSEHLAAVVGGKHDAWPVAQARRAPARRLQAGDARRGERGGSRSSSTT